MSSSPKPVVISSLSLLLQQASNATAGFEQDFHQTTSFAQQHEQQVPWTTTPASVAARTTSRSRLISPARASSADDCIATSIDSLKQDYDRDTWRMYQRISLARQQQQQQQQQESQEHPSMHLQAPAPQQLKSERTTCLAQESSSSSSSSLTDAMMKHFLQGQEHPTGDFLLQRVAEQVVPEQEYEDDEDAIFDLEF